MPRFVVFVGAPTLQQCLHAAEHPTTPVGSWHTALVPLPPPRSTSSSNKRQQPVEPEGGAEEEQTGVKDDDSAGRTHDEPLDDRTASQFADADVTGLFSTRKPAELVPSSQPEDDEPPTAPPSKRRRQEVSVIKQEVDDDAETTRSRASIFLPPPSQLTSRRASIRPKHPSQPAFQPSQNLSLHLPPTAPMPDISYASTMFADEGATYDSTFAGEGFSMGAPPELKWEIHDLVPLDQLRKRLKDGRRVSVLAAVVDYQASEEGSKLPTTVSLTDHTGQPTKLTLWRDIGREVLQYIRKGDILFVSDVTPKEYQGVVNLGFDEWSSRLGITWRSLVFDEEDERYRFHEGWRQHIPQAEAVLTEVDWFRRAFPMA